MIICHCILTKFEDYRHTNEMAPLRWYRKITRSSGRWSRSRGTLDPNERVIALPDGKPVAPLKKGFDQSAASVRVRISIKSGSPCPHVVATRHATFRVTTKLVPPNSWINQMFVVLMRLTRPEAHS